MPLSGFVLYVVIVALCAFFTVSTVRRTRGRGRAFVIAEAIALLALWTAIFVARLTMDGSGIPPWLGLVAVASTVVIGVSYFVSLRPRS
jgi:hypothetical protein